MALLFKKSYLAGMYTLAVVLHECAHYLVAKRLFYRCTEIKVGVFGAVLYGDFRDVAGSDRIKIALAGPMCNFALCLVCLAMWWLFPESYYFLDDFFTANLSMGCVNLLPCYPLDGGRVLTGILDTHTPKALRITQICTYACSFLCFGVFFVSLFTGDNLFNVGLFALGLFSGVLCKSGGECYTKFAAKCDRRRLKHGMEKKILVFDKSTSLRDVAKRMRGNFLYCLEVVDSELNVCCRFDVAQLESLVLDYPLDSTLSSLISREEMRSV